MTQPYSPTKARKSNESYHVNPSYYTSQLRSFLQKKQFAEAIVLVQNYFPSNAITAIHLAQLHLKMPHQDTEAENVLEDYLEQSDWARLWKARILIRREQWKDAWKWLMACISEGEHTRLQEEDSNPPTNFFSFLDAQDSIFACDSKFPEAEALYEAANILENFRYEPKELQDSTGHGMDPSYSLAGASQDARMRYEEEMKRNRILAQATKYYSRAIRYHHTESYYRLGHLHLSKSVPKQKKSSKQAQKSDEELAFEYFSKAAENQYPEAYFQLARLWETGKGAPKKSCARAAECYERAARMGNEAALFQCGMCYWEGRGVRPSTSRALYYLKKAKTHKAAIATKGLIYMEKKDYLNAIEAFREGAALNSSKCIYNLAKLFLKGTRYSPRNIEKARILLREAASLGNAHALCDLGVLLMNEGNNVEAYRLFEKARKAGSHWATLNLAQMHERDDSGILQDVEKARHFYTEAARYKETQRIAREKLESLPEPLPQERAQASR